MSELLISLKARRDAANNFSMNIAMSIESQLLDAQIEAIENREKKSEDFLKLVEDFEAAVEEESWSGSKDPFDRPDIKREYDECKQKLLNYEKEKEV